MKTLQTIQRTFNVFRILAKIAEILCIAGAAACAVSAICAATWNNGGQVLSVMGKPLEVFADGDMLRAYVDLLSLTFVLAADAILFGLAHRYFRSELADGTPFTEAGAERLKRLGIRCIYIPVIAISVSTTIAAWQGMKPLRDFDDLPGIVTGIILILTSLVFRYGSELGKNQVSGE